jgi:hypothetical protein
MKNLSQYVELKEDFLKAIESMTWKVTPVGAYNDAEEIIDKVPEFEGNKPIKDSVNFYKMRLIATNETDEIMEDEEIIILSKTLDKFKDLERRDRVTIKLDRDMLEVRPGRFEFNVNFYVSKVTKGSSTYA